MEDVCAALLSGSELLPQRRPAIHSLVLLTPTKWRCVSPTLDHHNDTSMSVHSSPQPLTLKRRSTMPSFNANLTYKKETHEQLSPTISAHPRVEHEVPFENLVETSCNNLRIPLELPLPPVRRDISLPTSPTSLMVAQSETGHSSRFVDEISYSYRPSKRSLASGTVGNRHASMSSGHMIRSNESARTAMNPVLQDAMKQTRTGEFMFKYTRRSLRNILGDRLHRRFFWVDPYIRALYWSPEAPESRNPSDVKAKSGVYDNALLFLLLI